VLLANNYNDNQSNALFRNLGTGNNWIKLNLVGTQSNYSAVGAKIRMRSTINGDQVWQTRQITAASGYCSQNSYTVHFGAGNAALIDEIEVHWPSGLIENYTNIDVNRKYTAIEGDGVLGSEEHKILEINLFPNPVKDTLTIASDMLSSYDSLSIELFSLDGKRILGYSLEETTQFSIDLSQLNSGIYLYVINSENSVISSGKLIKF